MAWVGGHYGLQLEHPVRVVVRTWSSVGIPADESAL